MAAIVVVGSLNMDLVAVVPRLPGPGETLLGSQYFTAHGGKGANQAYAAAKLGGDVAMLGRVGSDEYGRQMRANLQAVGCDVTGVEAVDGSSGLAMILVAESGQNSIVVVPGANHRLLPGDLERGDARLAQAQIVLLQLESPAETVLEAARRAKPHGAQVILDPAPALPNPPPDLFKLIDVLTPNESEAAHLLGRQARDLTTDDAASIARKLQSLGPPTVIVKMGSQGCLLAEGRKLRQIPAPSVTVADTTAAGDVFNAALAVARAEGASLEKACEFAVRAAAVSVTRFGAQPSAPSRDEVTGFRKTLKY